MCYLQFHLISVLYYTVLVVSHKWEVLNAKVPLTFLEAEISPWCPRYGSLTWRWSWWFPSTACSAVWWPLSFRFPRAWARQRPLRSSSGTCRVSGWASFWLLSTLLPDMSCEEKKLYGHMLVTSKLKKMLFI